MEPSTTPGVQFTTGTTDATSQNEPWRNNGTGTVPHQHTLPPHTTNPMDCNGLFSNSLNSSNNRNGPTCFKCKETRSYETRLHRVFCNHCKSGGHCDRTCRKLRNNTPSPTNSHIPTGYHPTATPLPLNAPTTTTNAMTQLNTNSGPWYHNYQDTNFPRTSTAVHTLPINNMSPAQ